MISKNYTIYFQIKIFQLILMYLAVENTSKTTFLTWSPMTLSLARLFLMIT